MDHIRWRVDEHPHTENDEPLAARGLAPLSAYFALWTDPNQRVFDTVPEDRLLVVKTGEILDRLGEIATFAGGSPHTLRADLGWQFAAPGKHPCSPHSIPPR